MENMFMGNMPAVRDPRVCKAGQVVPRPQTQMSLGIIIGNFSLEPGPFNMKETERKN
jgi:hypothetical protein